MYDFGVQNVAKTGSICPTFKQKTRHIACLPTSYLIDFMPFRWTNWLSFRQTTVPTVIFREGIIPTKPHITIYILISYILYIEVSDPHFSTDTLIQLIRFLTVHFSLQGPIGFRIGARSFSFLYPAPRQQPLCSFSAPTQPLGIPKRAAWVCEGYAYTMRRVCERYANALSCDWNGLTPRAFTWALDSL